MRNRKVLAMVLAVVMVLSGLLPIEAMAAKTQISNKKITLTVGQSKTLTVKKGKQIVKKVKWSTNNKKVATVKKGKVTAKKAGIAVITAKAGEKVYRCKVTVKAKKPVPKTTKPATTPETTKKPEETTKQSEENTKQPEETVKLEPVTLDVKTVYADQDSNAGKFQQAVEEWQQKTGCTVNDQSQISSMEYMENVSKSFDEGNEPDVLYYMTSLSDKFVSEGKVVSIEEIKKEYPNYAGNMKERLLPKSSVDGKAYAIPVNSYWEGMFVNKEILKKAGVAMPTKDTTWEQFLEMCKKIKAAGYTPIASSLYEVQSTWIDFTVFNNSDISNSSKVPLEANDDAAKAVAGALNDMKVLYENGYLPDNVMTVSQYQLLNMFSEGKAAFFLDGSWTPGQLEKNVDDIDKFAVMHFPGKANRKTTESIGGLNWGYFITRKAWNDPKKRAAAVNLISHLTSDKWTSKFSGIALTALKNGIVTEGMEMNALRESIVSYLKEITGLADSINSNLLSGQRECIMKSLADVVQGKMSAEDVVNEVINIGKNSN